MSNWFLDPERALSPDEVVRVLAAARTALEAGLAAGRFRQARDSALVVFLLATGVRVTEAVSITLADITLRKGGGEARVRLLKKALHKDGARPVGVVFLAKEDADDLRPYVRMLGADSATPLFPLGPPDSPRAAKAMSRQAASKAVKRILASVGIERPGLAAHGLRHAVGVLTQAATRNTRFAQAPLHHSSSRTAETCAKVAVEDYRNAIDEIAAGLRRGGAG